MFNSQKEIDTELTFLNMVDTYVATAGIPRPDDSVLPVLRTLASDSFAIFEVDESNICEWEHIEARVILFVAEIGARMWTERDIHATINPSKSICITID